MMLMWVFSLAGCALLYNSAQAAAAADRGNVHNVSHSSGFVVVRQDSNRQGFLEFINSNNGETVEKSTLSFPFNAPYVEMSTDAKSGQTYLAAFPDGYTYPALYLLERDLSVSYAWEDNTFTFWDIQCSPEQSTLYGIKVTEDFNGGMYGRTISNYTADQSTGIISANELYTLPYMWYVNASSFDKANSIYYALVNNFPGHENSTQEQQLLVGDVSIDASIEAPDMQLYQISSGNVMLQFIAYSESTNKLFFSGISKETKSLATTAVATVGVVCQETGKVKEIKYTVHGVIAVGPIVANEANKRLDFYIQLSVNPTEWKLYSLSYNSDDDVTEINTYVGENYASYGAAGFMLT